MRQASPAFWAVLFMYSCLLAPGPGLAGPNQNAKILIHLMSPSLKNTCTRSGLSIDCRDMVTSGDLEQGYFAYLMVARGDSAAGVSGVECGIRYKNAPNVGVDVFSWTLCADLEFTAGDWPDSAGSTVITWNTQTHCQTTIPVPGQGVVAVAGYFYCAAYSLDALIVRTSYVSGSAKVADCASVEDALPAETALGSAYFIDGVTPGFNPCVTSGCTLPTYAAPLVSPPAVFPHIFSIETTPYALADSPETNCASDPENGWSYCQFDSLAELVMDGTANALTGNWPTLWNYLGRADRDLDARPDYLTYVSGADTLSGVIIKLYDSNCGGQTPTPGEAGHQVKNQAYVRLNKVIGGFEYLSAGDFDGPNALWHELAHVIVGDVNRSTSSSVNVEFQGVLGEYLIGDRWENSFNDAYDYDITLTTNPLEASGCSTCKYDEYRLFSAYLFNQFPGPNANSPKDDLMYQWLRTLHPEDSRPRIDLEGLAYYLSNIPDSLSDYYEGRLGDATGSTRLRRLFNRYGVARFVDSKSSEFHDGDFGFENAIKPWEGFDLFVYASGNGLLRPYTIPPEVILGEDFLDSGSEILGCTWTDPDSGTSAPTELWTWGTDYIVVRADSAAYTMHDPDTLYVRFESTDPVPSNNQLFANAVLYDISEPELFKRGLQAFAIQEEKGYTVGSRFYADFTIPDFGGDTKSVVLTLSMMETAISAADYPARMGYNVFFSTHPFPTALGRETVAHLANSWSVEENAGEGSFEIPGEIFAVGEEIYVLDAIGGYVKKFNPEGEYQATYTLSGPAYATDLAIAWNSMYVTDGQGNKVYKYTKTGTLLTSWGTSGSGNGQFSNPVGIALNADGNLVYVVDKNNSRVQKFDTTGTYLSSWGSAGRGDGQFTNPRGIVVEEGGYVYVSDYIGVGRIQVFTANGTFVQSITLATDCEVPFGPGLTLDRFDAYYVYVADPSNNRVVKLSTIGSPLSVWGGASPGLFDFDNPIAIASHNADVYVLNFGLNSGPRRVDHFADPVVGVPDEPVGARPFLLNPFPNPATSEVRIPLDIVGVAPTSTSEVMVKVYDVAGRLVRSLFDGELEAGIHELVWDGVADGGQRVRAGIYFTRVRVGTRIEARKFIWTR